MKKGIFALVITSSLLCGVARAEDVRLDVRIRIQPEDSDEIVTVREWNSQFPLKQDGEILSTGWMEISTGRWNIATTAFFKVDRAGKSDDASYLVSASCGKDVPGDPKITMRVARLEDLNDLTLDCGPATVAGFEGYLLISFPRDRAPMAASRGQTSGSRHGKAVSKIR